MLRAECYKQRMEKGLSFLEFNYMIMQSYDFYALFQKYGCNLQFGGDDQWSNMLGGTELIRRKLGKDAAAMTITLPVSYTHLPISSSIYCKFAVASNAENTSFSSTARCLSLIHISPSKPAMMASSRWSLLIFIFLQEEKPYSTASRKPMPMMRCV